MMTGQNGVQGVLSVALSVRVNFLYPTQRTQSHCAVSGVESEAGEHSGQCAGFTRLCNFRASSSSSSVFPLQLFLFNLSFQSMSVHNPLGESWRLLSPG